MLWIYLVAIILAALFFALGYFVGYDAGERKEECDCYNCKNESECIIHMTSNCDWCESWEEDE